MFNVVLQRLVDHRLVSTSKIEVLRQLADKVFTIWKKNVQDDEDFGEDIPNEYRGIIVSTYF
jgi:hypothetical protein